MVQSNPTIYDVASLAGVSVATVSRVINDSQPVRAVTVAKVRDAMAELKYMGNDFARGLSVGRKSILGFILPFDGAWVEYDNPNVMETAEFIYNDAVVRGVEAAATKHGYSILLRTVDSTRRDALEQVTKLAKSSDGIIMLDRILPDSAVKQLSSQLPVVMVSGSGKIRNALTVRSNNHDGLLALVDHLVLEHNVKSVAILTGPSDSPDAVERLAITKDAMLKHHRKVSNTNVIEGNWASGDAQEKVSRWLTGLSTLPDVLICGNDQMAIGATHALQHAGYNVPGDILVTGFDDLPASRYLNPPLTTIHQSTVGLGVEAVESLIAKIEGKKVKNTVTLPTRLIVRESCGCMSKNGLSLVGEMAS
jgi:LacI family transcriptional regulator